MAKKGLKFLSKIQNSHFCKKFDIFFRFFHRSSAKSRRTGQRKVSELPVPISQGLRPGMEPSQPAIATPDPDPCLPPAPHRGTCACTYIHALSSVLT